MILPQAATRAISASKPRASGDDPDRIDHGDCYVS